MAEDHVEIHGGVTVVQCGRCAAWDALIPLDIGDRELLACGHIYTHDPD